MKKSLSFFICLLILFSFAGCANAPKTSAQLNKNSLNSDFKFYSTDLEKYISVSNYLESLKSSDEDLNFYIYEYTFFDLNFDGNKELICRLGVGEDKTSGTILFSPIGDRIYGYLFTWRAFYDLKIDGTVSYSNSGTNFGFRNLTFDKDGYHSKSPTYSEDIYNDGEVVDINYYINNKKASKKEFDTAYKIHNETDDVKFQKIYLDETTFKYIDFISSKQNGIDSNGNEIKFSDYISKQLSVEFDDQNNGYGFYDMNGDGTVEMCVLGNGIYAYFTVKNDKVSTWSNIQSIYTYPLKNGNLLFKRDGGAPTHTNYEYYEVDFDGNILKTVTFSEWHMSEIDNNKDEYIFNDKKVSKEEYSTLTEQYLNYEKAPIEWLHYDELIFD